MQSLAPFLLFAVVASITPGPTNILVLSNSQRHGLAAAWPIVLGACAAVAALILLLGAELTEAVAEARGTPIKPRPYAMSTRASNPAFVDPSITPAAVSLKAVETPLEKKEDPS